MTLTPVKVKTEEVGLDSFGDAGVPVPLPVQPMSTVVPIKAEIEDYCVVAGDGVPLASQLPSMSTEQPIKQEDIAATSVPVVPLRTLVIVHLLSEDTTVVEEALDELADSMVVSKIKQREAFQVGAMTMVMAAMNRWKAHAPIQTQGCRCMQNMMWDMPESKQVFAQMGGIEAIVHALSTFPGYIDIQLNGIGALSVFTDTRGNDNDVVCQQKVVERFVHDFCGTEYVLYAMRAFQGKSLLQKWGLRVLSNLCRLDKKCQKILKEAGAISTVAVAVEQHSAKDIQMEGQLCMNALMSL